jgi:hypothetical protein
MSVLSTRDETPSEHGSGIGRSDAAVMKQDEAPRSIEVKNADEDPSDRLSRLRALIKAYSNIHSQNMESIEYRLRSTMSRYFQHITTMMFCVAFCVAFLLCSVLAYESSSNLQKLYVVIDILLIFAILLTGIATHDTYFDVTNELQYTMTSAVAMGRKHLKHEQSSDYASLLELIRAIYNDASDACHAARNLRDAASASALISQRDHHLGYSKELWSIRTRTHRPAEFNLLDDYETLVQMLVKLTSTMVRV